ncbi:hypothetical protein ABZ135_13010 [Streptomyces sp. NPDC006339]|uniref:hypothetical protein n=1 Tax=Streptomyces sp. NPDC006339 TaxID=3156755 RepID=UPI0033BA8210
MLTHSLAALGGLLVGVLIALVGSSGGTETGGSQPPAAPDSTTAGPQTPPPASTPSQTAPARTPAEQRGTTKATAQEIPGDGTFLVGSEVQPGTYRSAGPADGLADCYWARLKGTTGELGDIVANHAGKGPATVTILATDKAFQTSGCQTWKRLT